MPYQLLSMFCNNKLSKVQMPQMPGYELLNKRVCLQQSCLAAGLGCVHQSSFVCEHITSAIIRVIMQICVLSCCVCRSHLHNAIIAVHTQSMS